MNRKSTLICLIRHGESHANVRKLVTGTPQDGLTAQGISQARNAFSHIYGLRIPFDSYFVSQWKRAQETASIIFPHIPLVEDARLGETHAGQCAEWLESDFRKQYPDFRSAFDPSRPYPGGESHQQLYHRTLDWFYDVSASKSSCVAAVTHAGPIACLLHHTLGIPMERFPCLLPANTGICLLQTYNTGEKTELVSFNHLLSPTIISQRLTVSQ